MIAGSWAAFWTYQINTNERRRRRVKVTGVLLLLLDGIWSNTNIFILPEYPILHFLFTSSIKVEIKISDCNILICTDLFWNVSLRYFTVENKNYKMKKIHFSYKKYFSEVDLIKHQSSKWLGVAIFITATSYLLI